MNKITEVIDYLQAAGVMYISTFDGQKPKVRPIGFVMEFDGQAFFTTATDGPIYNELQINPYLEIATMHPEKSFHRIRFSGKAVFDATPAAFEKYFEYNPDLRGVPNINLYRVDEWKAIIYEGFQDKKIITM